MSRDYFPIPNYVDNPEPTAELLSELLSIIRPMRVPQAQQILDGTDEFRLNVIEKVAVTLRPGSTNTFAIVPSVLQEAEREITEDAVDYFNKNLEHDKAMYPALSPERNILTSDNLIWAIMMKTLILWLLPEATDKENWPKYYVKNR